LLLASIKPCRSCDASGILFRFAELPFARISHAQMQRTQTVRAVVERKSTVYEFENHAQTTGQET
jgi:hypothetical protein